ncbi:pyridoxamine 5'-phosphate oxidase [Actinomadura oligospora]|uniref:pyridoxamine 5'-phosphate oxidase n=1 Tax=Actinomadura oligospora TaxID=111804 RepID=UPI0004AD310E|nr:pyridoxamine 5'-phosphate oxidase [Actinomadura oligospora]
MAEEGLPAEPFLLFAEWFSAAASVGLPEPNAMIVATATPDGVPSARTVLLKGFGSDGFRFFTNLVSRKGRELAANPRAALVFPWHPMQRQVRVEGTVSELSREDVRAYFDSRPHGSRIGAWASRQSTVVEDRSEFEERYAALEDEWPDGVPLPDFWGGYLVVPEAVEFWQGRRNRLHDRIRYRREGDAWKVERLSP